MTTPDHDPSFLSDALIAWRYGTSAGRLPARLNPDRSEEELIRPAVAAWQASADGDAKILAAVEAGWRFGYSPRTFIRQIARAADVLGQEIRSSRDRQSSQPPDLPADTIQRAIQDADAIIDLCANAGKQDHSRAVARFVQDQSRYVDRVGRAALARTVMHEGPQTHRLLTAALYGWDQGVAVAEDLAGIYIVQRVGELARPGALRLLGATAGEWTQRLTDGLRHNLATVLGPHGAARAAQNAIRAATTTADAPAARRSVFPRLTTVDRPGQTGDPIPPPRHEPPHRPRHRR